MYQSNTLPNHFSPNLLRAAIAACCISMTTLPVVAKAKSRTTSSSKAEVQRLQREVERLQAQNNELRQSINQAKHSPASKEVNKAPMLATDTNPFAAKDIAPQAGRIATSSKVGEMTCGGSMNMSAGMPKEHRFTMNPVWGGLDMFWNMPKDSLMMNVKWMHNQQGGLQKGTETLSSAKANSQYMMPPTSQAMDMFMFMPMWGVTEDLTLMAMINYQYMSMPMNMSMMGNAQPSAPMNVGGIGDTNLDAIYRIADNLVGTFQINIPSGSTQQMYSPGAMTPENCAKGMGPGC